MRPRLPRRRLPLLAASAAALALFAPAAAAGRAQGAAAPAPREAAEGVRYRSGDAALDALQDLFRETLAANRRQFQGRLGRVSGFGAGDSYPQIWLRDSATLVPLARYLYPREELVSWLEEHLASQRPEGGLYDWVAAGPADAFRQWAPRAAEVHRAGPLVVSADTNTTEADQESSAVEAAYQYWRASGDDAWLRKPILGRGVLERLTDALRFVLTRRFEPRLGLAVSALTADWGDVSPTYPDQRAIYQDDATPLAAGLYTNAMLLRACSRLAEMHDTAGDPVRAAHFRARAALLRSSLNGLLWQEREGFYRMHLATTRDRAAGFPDDAGIFALGGNALALLAGAASEAQVASVLSVAEARRRAHGLPTIAGVLLPPYPAGAFRHPALATEWSYQNGGEWDWFSGRLLLAAFERGHSAWARDHLEAVAARVARSGGLYEWVARDGRGQGSARYAGSAGALADAVLHGLFGVGLRGKGLDLCVRLGERSGEVRLRQPMTGGSVAYRYQAGPRRLALAYEASAEGRGRVALRLPPRTRAAGATLDGAPVAVAAEVRGEDAFVVVESDWRPHRLEVSLAPVR